MMLTRYDQILVAKIYREVYKWAEIIDEGLHQQQSEDDDGGSYAVMKKWTERLESVAYNGSAGNNIERQILYMNVISMMCRDY